MFVSYACMKFYHSISVFVAVTLLGCATAKVVTEYEKLTEQEIQQIAHRGSITKKYEVLQKDGKPQQTGFVKVVKNADGEYDYIETGIWREYDKNNKLYSETAYDNNGVLIYQNMYNPKGNQIFQVVSYAETKDGKELRREKNIAFSGIKPNDTLQVEVFIREGKQLIRDGEVRYFENGRVYMTELYDGGKKIK